MTVRFHRSRSVPLAARALSGTVFLLVACAPSDGEPADAGRAAAEGEPTLAEVVERHTEAVGGEAALDAIRNVMVVQEIVEPSFTVTGRYRATLEGTMRIDVVAGGQRVFAEGIDGRGAWGWSPDGGVQPASEAGAAALRHGIEYNLFGLHRFPERGHELELEDSEVVDGVPYHVVKTTLSDGFETYLYVHPESWLIERRRDVRALHPDMDPEELLLETVYLDFDEHCGVMTSTASRQVDRTSGEVLQTSRTLERRCNLTEDELEIPRDAGV